MRRRVEFETTIKGGLPVLVKAVLHPPEPDVGILGWQPEYELFWLKGKPCRLEISDEDNERIMYECIDAIQ